MSPAVWYAARSAGIVAYLLLSGSVVLVGVSMSSKRKLQWPRFAVEEVHRFLSLLTGVFIVLHGGSLLLDRVVPFSLAQVLVPFTSSYRPLTVGLGVGRRGSPRRDRRHERAAHAPALQASGGARTTRRSPSGSGPPGTRS